MNRLAATFKTVRRLLSREDGVTLVAALGVSVALGASVTGAMAYTGTNSRSAYVSRADQLALALAEAGMNNAMAVISNPANDPMDPTLVPPTAQTYEGGRAAWSGTLDRANAMWTVTAVGEATNPTDADARPIMRGVTVQVQVTPAPARNPETRMWDYMVATRTGGTCDMTVNASVSGASPLYVLGNLCLAAGAQITGGPLVVKGLLHLQARDSAVGSTLTPIANAHLPGGCKYYRGDVHLICSPVDNVFANVLDQTPPPLALPRVEWGTWYEHAMPGPKHSCTAASGTVPVFDTNGVRDRSVPTTFNLTPAASYSCRVGPADNPLGELSWDASTKVLTVRGTIFIDGSAKVENGAVNTYEGRGTLYLSGTYNVTGSSKLCAVASGGDCDFGYGNWNPNTKLFTVVADGNGGSGLFTGNSIQIGCYDRHQGALYASHAIQFASGAKHQGPIVAATIALGSSAQTYPFPSASTLPAGMPGGGIAFANAGRPSSYSD